MDENIKIKTSFHGFSSVPTKQNSHFQSRLRLLLRLRSHCILCNTHTLATFFQQRSTEFDWQLFSGEKRKRKKQQQNTKNFSHQKLRLSESVNQSKIDSEFKVQQVLIVVLVLALVLSLYLVSNEWINEWVSVGGSAAASISTTSTKSWDSKDTNVVV